MTISAPSSWSLTLSIVLQSWYALSNMNGIHRNCAHQVTHEEALSFARTMSFDFLEVDTAVDKDSGKKIFQEIVRLRSVSE
jgi:ActR/RegA family two-component response regulator